MYALSFEKSEFIKTSLYDLYDMTAWAVLLANMDDSPGHSWQMSSILDSKGQLDLLSLGLFCAVINNCF